MLYLVCGHIVKKKKKNYNSIQYVYFVLHHSLATNVQNGSTTERPSENIQSQFSYNLNGVIGSHALYSFFVSFTLLFKMNLSLKKKEKKSQWE